MRIMFGKLIDILFRDEAYGIAIRRKHTKRFHSILPNGRYSFADPFVFEYNGKTAVFVELMDYHYGWGTIGCFVIEHNRVLPVKEIIRENNHMSFPNVFEHNGELYMIPETYGANDVHLYKCKMFPDVWEKQAPILSNVHLVDHAVFDDGNDTYVVSYDLDKKASRCFLIDWSEGQLKEFYPEGSYCMERPGGSFFRYNSHLLRVIQDCKKTYGDFVKFYEVDTLNDRQFEEHLIKEKRVEDYCFDKNRSFAHTHQYSVSENYEVIDYHYPRFYWNKGIRFLIRVVFHPHRHFR